MRMEKVSANCYAVLNEKNRLCDANSGFINLGGGVVIDTQSDLAHARQMIELFGQVWSAMPARVILTHEDSDHVYGSQLFEGAEFIAHRSVPEQMKKVADPDEMQKLLGAVDRFLTRTLLKVMHPGVVADADQLREGYNFEGVNLTFPRTLFDDRYEFDLDGVAVHTIYVGPCHRFGDSIVHVPDERVIFSGDVLFQRCAPIGWIGTFQNWFRCLDRIIDLDPDVIVPGHGPPCGIDGVREMKAYLEYVRDEAKRCFDRGLSSLDAAKTIDLGPYADWNCSSRIYLNVERAYREFRREHFDAPWDIPKSLDGLLKVAKARGIPPEF